MTQMWSMEFPGFTRIWNHGQAGGGGLLTVVRHQGAQIGDVTQDPVVPGQVSRVRWAHVGGELRIRNAHNFGLSPEAMSVVDDTVRAELEGAAADPLSNMVVMMGGLNVHADGIWGATQPRERTVLVHRSGFSGVWWALESRSSIRTGSPKRCVGGGRRRKRAERPHVCVCYLGGHPGGARRAATRLRVRLRWVHSAPAIGAPEEIRGFARSLYFQNTATYLRRDGMITMFSQRSGALSGRVLTTRWWVVVRRGSCHRSHAHFWSPTGRCA